jgi:hypothetical protein
MQLSVTVSKYKRHLLSLHITTIPMLLLYVNEVQTSMS